MNYKLGSLFSGSGGFELAGSLCGIEPVWASEVEPYPIAVTRSRFPKMKHLGDISKINGGEIEPVDIITFGSPCQDLSVAGKRAGLKHEANGDEETTRSGLFMEAVRIIKEMRKATNGRYPTFIIWENVPGAFSSNNGDDFRVVLEEIIKIKEPTATMPPADKNGWPYADCYMGDGWSVAYRTFDAQYWGVPQRRRRIHLVADFTGECAADVLFEREGLRGYFEASRTPWQGIAADAERGSGTADSAGERICVGFDRYNQCVTGEVSETLRTPGGGDNYPCVIVPLKAMGVENHPADSRVSIDESGKVQTLTSRMGTGGGNVPLVMQPFCKSARAIRVCSETIALEGNGQRPSHHGDGYVVSDKSYTLNTTEVHGVAYGVESPIVLDRAFYNQGQNAQYDPQYYEDGTVPTIVARGPSAVCYWDGTQTCGTLTANNSNGAQRMPDKENFNCVIQTDPYYIVRRLTPTECARLQGFADCWGIPDKKSEFTDEEYRFWLEVRKTYDAINERKSKDYTKYQMLKWYNKLHTDSAEYKMWGNGIALPPALYCMQGIIDALKERN
jgi:DNA (cytosine-5)-methyltransferase 1